VSSGSFYQQNSGAFNALDEYGYWKTALTGETFVSEGTPTPIFAGGNLFLDTAGYPKST
jgi:hypothetical protein